MDSDKDLRNAVLETSEYMQELDVLCTVCQRIVYASQVLPDLTDDDETFDNLPSLTALTESATHECHMSSLMDSAVSHYVIVSSSRQ